jgi:transposase
VIADKAYSQPSTRIALRSKKIRVVIPEKSDQIARRQGKGSAGGRPPSFDATRYRDRNVVERAFNRLKGWRGLATRYDKHARNYPRRSRPGRHRAVLAPMIHQTGPSRASKGCDL